MPNLGPKFPETPMFWEDNLNKDNRPDSLVYEEKKNVNTPIPGPNDPWQASEIVGSKKPLLATQLQQETVVSHLNGRNFPMRKRLTNDTLETQSRLKTAGKVIDLASKLASAGATDDEILRIARKIEKLPTADLDEIHTLVSKIATESGRKAFSYDDAVDDDGDQKQPDPTKTEDYVKVVRAPTDSSVQMSLKGQKDVYQPTASRFAADDEFEDEDEDYSFEDDEESEDNFDDMNDDDGLDDEDTDVDEEPFEFGDDDEDDFEMSSEAQGMEDPEAPQVVDEDELVEDSDLEEDGDDESVEDFDDAEDVEAMDSDSVDSDDFVYDGSESSMFDLDDMRHLEEMGISSGAESAGVVSNRSLAMTRKEASPETFKGHKPARRSANFHSRPEYSVWETENEPLISLQKPAKKAPKKASNTKSRKASATNAVAKKAEFRPSRVRTAAPRTDSDVFSEMFETPDVSQYFEH